jgi:ethanolamine utilization protein EutP
MQHNKNIIVKPKIMLIGGVGAGKSSLAACLNNSKEEVRKTQSLIYSDNTIDTPGEYLENPFMYRNIIAVAEEADWVIFVQALDQIRCVYPPGMARSFNRHTVGVVTKADEDSDNLQNVLLNFKEMGLEEPYFITSAKTGKGIKSLKKHLFTSQENNQ